MLDGVTYGGTERKEEDHADDPERSPKEDVADRPAGVESTEDEDKLREYIHCHADEWPEEIYDP